MIAQLCALGALINARDSQGQTPLHVAAKQDHPETLELLYLLGATIDALDNANQTPAYLAAYSGHLPNMLQLSEYGANLKAKNDMGLSPIDIYNKQLTDKVSSTQLTEMQSTPTMKDQLSTIKKTITEETLAHEKPTRR